MVKLVVKGQMIMTVGQVTIQLVCVFTLYNYLYMLIYRYRYRYSNNWLDRNIQIYTLINDDDILMSYIAFNVMVNLNLLQLEQLW